MIDIASKTWSLVRSKCEEGIKVSTEICLRSGLQPHEYDAARGEIAAFRAVLAMGEPLRVEAGDYSKRKDRSGI
ncbi:hypothetical protein [Mesorhizobium sp. B2-1-2]|uniref:hypothetical protein n=1 Tax=Mesorhizobium sp. B2-1-2 TaxID=2589973 RepID=UPI00112A6945|nr:hypothetical protein [Mesorhizobium sp. B2-1-2]TPN11719.1 hypothetical protein FJ971_09945 [Mesorhizobium sp. B2-1-2]